jgi:hypothetical protein
LENLNFTETPCDLREPAAGTYKGGTAFRLCEMERIRDVHAPATESRAVVASVGSSRVKLARNCTGCHLIGRYAIHPNEREFA